MSCIKGNIFNVFCFWTQRACDWLLCFQPKHCKNNMTWRQAMLCGFSLSFTKWEQVVLNVKLLLLWVTLQNSRRHFYIISSILFRLQSLFCLCCPLCDLALCGGCSGIQFDSFISQMSNEYFLYLLPKLKEIQMKSTMLIVWKSWWISFLQPKWSAPDQPTSAL